MRTLVSWRLDLSAYRDVEAAFRISLTSLARRYLELHDKIADLDIMIGVIVEDFAPELITRNSIGQNGAAQLLLTVGDNPERLRSEASFAALCGVSLVPASSGKTIRQTARCTSSPSYGSEPTQRQRPRLPSASPKGIPSSAQSGPSRPVCGDPLPCPAIAMPGHQAVAVENAGNQVVAGDQRQLPDGRDDLCGGAVVLSTPALWHA